MDDTPAKVAGQLRTKAALNYETKKTYMVTVTAHDGTSNMADASASIDVTIHVTNEDEAPMVSGKGIIMEYRENGKGSVTTLSASDPERVGTTVWDLLTEDDGIQDIDGNGDDDVGPADIVDNEDFKITDAGVLSFGSPPNFEAPTDRQASEEDSSGSTAAAENDNIYRVTVRASDGTTGETRGYYKIVVTVTDREEDGTIVVTVDPDGGGAEAPGQDLLQFQPGAILTATLSDGDGDVTGTVWKWSGVGDTANTEAYTVVDSPAPHDVGKRLKVTASYTDRRGDGKTATFTMPNPVQDSREADDNNVPEFASPDVTRTVSEGATGMEVGVEVTATDADDDILTYMLGDGGDNDLFSVDKETGQITTGAGLNYEAAGGTAGQQCAAANECEITVTATDSMGGEATAMVTITVTDVNEAPSLNLATGLTETQKVLRIERSENMTALSDDGETAIVYTGVDPEDSVVELTTDGADGSLFELSATEAEDGYTYTLAFKAKPDFEMPTDSNKDNIYEVTVVATDGEGFTAMRYVTVKVTNVEEAGKVTLPTAQPRVGTAITAVLTDSDMFSEATVEWQWQISEDDGSTWDDIGSATMATYTPVVGDKDDHLRAMVTYYDMTYAGDDDQATAGITAAVSADASYDRFKNMATSDSSLMVAASIANNTPKFDEGASTERFVRENTDEGTAIGAPVTAMDDDGDTLAYTLGGRDAAMFDIDGGTAPEDGDTPAKVAGQLRTKAALNYETKKTYMVTVTAHDGTSNMADASASIDVTIYVTNVDEAPEIMEGGLAISGISGVDYEENGMDAVATYIASGPMSDDAMWSLSGDDHGSFSISSGGILSFTSSPDFEMPGDTDGDNVYMVTVEADDGTYMDTHAVTVTVTNDDDDGMVTLTPETKVGAEITAELDDPDGGVTGVMWQWASAGDDGEYTDITGATSTTYTPVADDEGKTLQATATYDDAEGSGKSAADVTAAIAPAFSAMDYDADDNGEIDLDEVEQAILDFFLPDSTLTVEQVEAVILLYITQ